jgi:hypothetical protein
MQRYNPLYTQKIVNAKPLATFARFLKICQWWSLSPDHWFWDEKKVVAYLEYGVHFSTCSRMAWRGKVEGSLQHERRREKRSWIVCGNQYFIKESQFLIWFWSAENIDRYKMLGNRTWKSTREMNGHCKNETARVLSKSKMERIGELLTFFNGA